MDHRQFLERLFANKPNNSSILIHQLPLMRSNFFPTAKDASDLVDGIINGPHNIYTTGGLIRNGVQSGRGKEEDVVGVVGMWADIDCKGENKPRGVDNMDEAVKLVMGHGIDPTLIVSTGGGIHPWWLFKEPLVFKNNDERLKQKMRCQRLQETIRQRAKKKGWDIDSTYDVNRVLRLPGTFNRKDPSNPLEVTLLDDTGIEYADPENDFEDYIISEQDIKMTRVPGGIVHISTDLILDPNAEPPSDRFQDLCDIDSNFDQTFRGDRGENDTKNWQDTSASSYAQSLANMMAAAGWTDQEMANTIIAFYRNAENNQEATNITGTPALQKALRPPPANSQSYMERTIGLARTSVDGLKVKDYLKNMSPLIGTEHEKKIDPTGNKARETVNLALGGTMEIISITEHMAEKNATYVIQLKMPTIVFTEGLKKIDWVVREVSFDTTQQFYNLKTFKERIFERTQVSLRIKTAYWDNIIRPNFKAFMKVQQVGEQTVKTRMQYWLECYLENKDAQSMEDAAMDSSPFIHKGFWHVFADKFNVWAATTGKSQFGVVKSEMDFSAIDGVRKRYDIKSSYDGKRKTLRPWKIPTHIITPPFLPKVIKGEKEDPIDKQSGHQLKSNSQGN
jgi:hypothetical protein